MSTGQSAERIEEQQNVIRDRMRDPRYRRNAGAERINKAFRDHVSEMFPDRNGEVIMTVELPLRLSMLDVDYGKIDPRDSVLLSVAHVFNTAAKALPPASPVPVDDVQPPRWTPMTQPYSDSILGYFSRTAAARGKSPDQVFCLPVQGVGILLAQQYLEPGKWERWAIRPMHEESLEVSWSTMLSWLRPLIGNRAAIEVYPQDGIILDRAPFRWFWILPDGVVPSEFNLNFGS